MDAECPICQTDMGHPSFQSGCSEDTDVGPTVFRLKCGHAFHTGCICRSLRTDTACPVCRAGSSPSALQLIVGPDGTMQLLLADDDSTAGDEDGSDDGSMSANIMAMARHLQTVMRLPRIQQERARTNAMLKAYRMLHEHLQHKRAQVVQSALAALRLEDRPQYDATKRALARQLRHLQRAEEAELAKLLVADGHTPDHARAQVNAYGGLRYDVDAVLPDGFGPHKRSFWTT